MLRKQSAPLRVWPSCHNLAAGEQSPTFLLMLFKWKGMRFPRSDL